jgi:hypothetical protein
VQNEKLLYRPNHHHIKEKSQSAVSQKWTRIVKSEGTSSRCIILTYTGFRSLYNFKPWVFGFHSTDVATSKHNIDLTYSIIIMWLHLWSSDHSSCLLTQRSRVLFRELPDILRSRGSRTGSTQHREDKWGATCKKNSGSGIGNWH